MHDASWVFVLVRTILVRVPVHVTIINPVPTCVCLCLCKHCDSAICNKISFSLLSMCCCVMYKQGIVKMTKHEASHHKSTKHVSNKHDM